MKGDLGNFAIEALDFALREGLAGGVVAEEEFELVAGIPWQARIPG